MHYIVGAMFRVGVSRQGSGPRSITNQQANRRAVGQFTSDQVYTLYNIEVIDKQFKYIFVDANRNKFDQLFESSREADKFIANVIGEQLPDYDEFYRKSSA